MLQGLIIIATVTVAILVGQSYPMLGGLIAMFPLKMVAYAAASTPETAAQGVWGLFVGSLGSVACAAAMLLTLRYGMPTALGSGLAAWALVAMLGRAW